ncbi:MAG: hypothetical protein ACTHJ4_08230 [Candidatus Nucleicultricaceae bacterium]
MRLKSVIVGLSFVVISHALMAGRFDIDCDIKDGGNHQRFVHVYDSTSNKVERVVKLHYGLNSFEDVPEYQSSTSLNKRVTLLIQITREEQPSASFMEIESGALISLLSYGIASSDPSIIRRVTVETNKLL